MYKYDVELFAFNIERNLYLHSLFEFQCHHLKTMVVDFGDLTRDNQILIVLTFCRQAVDEVLHADLGGKIGDTEALDAALSALQTLYSRLDSAHPSPTVCSQSRAFTVNNSGQQ